MREVVLASASLHDGGGIFTLVWALVVTPWGLAMVLNYRGIAERVNWRGGGKMSPASARIFGLIFLAFGILAFGLAVNRFAQGGY